MANPIPCVNCGASVPEEARFCAACGHPTQSDAVTIGMSQPTELSPGELRGSASRRSPSVAKSPSSGWLTSSDSISHGRFAPGDVFDGRYRIIGLLGRGGMGEVYRADDLRLGQPVALKLLPDDLRHEPTRLAQFHNEVRTARQVSHPNVCRVYDIGEAGDLLYLSMEYVDGEDLSTSLRRIGRFPEDKAADLARQLCAGLAAAHQRGVVHRDLKPANVMLDGTGRVRIMDFGLAAVGRVEDIRAGTPAYMAPEQLLGREVTARSDIFALGLVIYELFTGKRAFTATTIGELVSQHENRSLVRPSTIVTTLDPAIERAILACLDPDPDRRPASALGGLGCAAGRRSAGRRAGGGRNAVARDGRCGWRGRGLARACGVAALGRNCRRHRGVVRDGPENEPARQDASRVHRGSARAESARRRPSARVARAARATKRSGSGGMRSSSATSRRPTSRRRDGTRFLHNAPPRSGSGIDRVAMSSQA